MVVVNHKFPDRRNPRDRKSTASLNTAITQCITRRLIKSRMGKSEMD